MNAGLSESGRRQGLHAASSRVRPVDTLQLSDQLALCQHGRGSFSVLCLADAVNHFVAARLITTVLAATAVLMLVAQML